MNALKPRPAFDVIVMSEESRLGREAIETAYALKQIMSAGVKVFFYLSGRERTFESATDKLLMSVTAFADEFEREKARQRTYDALERKAKSGHVTGGRVSGTTTWRSLVRMASGRTWNAESTRPRPPWCGGSLSRRPPARGKTRGAGAQ
jgi:DNA invertase Pin-like site-specific DNA recombinase